MTVRHGLSNAFIAAAAVALAGMTAQADQHDVGFTSERYCDAHAARPPERQSNFGNLLCSNAEGIDQNGQAIETTMMMSEANREMIMSNDADIAGNTEMIMSNDADIAANVERLGMHETMIGNNSSRLMEHGATLARHDQMLSRHASLIDGNTAAIEMLDERVNQVAAMAAALSAVPNAPSVGEQFFIGVGVGNHSGESSLAVGLSGRVGPKQNILVNAGVANSSGETTVRAGVGWAF